MKPSSHPPARRCAYCGAFAEGTYSVHRDGFGVGPEVDLCNDCGSGDSPTLAAIWAHIGQVEEER